MTSERKERKDSYHPMTLLDLRRRLASFRPLEGVGERQNGFERMVLDTAPASWNRQSNADWEDILIYTGTAVSSLHAS